MAKAATKFVCQECGGVHTRWAGRCDACGGWNTLVEEAPATVAPKGVSSRGGTRIAFVPLDGAPVDSPRRVSGIGEFDRVCGGGLVPGSGVLVGGDPGIGKSTLLLQVMAALAKSGHRCVYVSGEESVDQVRLRAARLGAAAAPVSLAAATSVRDILATLDTKDAADVVVVDSIQTMFVDVLDSAPGTVAQVRSSAQELIRLAKRRGMSVLLVGHVTKDGMIAGPKVMEHMVDTVLYFEGDRGHRFRILRAVKNRYGPTDEIGVFAMTDTGLAEVANPSQLFLADRRGDVSGAAVFAGLEGTRPVLVEIQSLISPSPLGTPRRTVVGWDASRLAMILAVLEARCGFGVAGCDVYLNVAGGLRISEPAADLAVAAALVSARNDQPMPAETVVFGEVGLGGEVRAVGHADTRLKEAAKLGFTRAIVPAGRGAQPGHPASGLTVEALSHLSELVEMFAGAPARHAAGGA